MRLPQIGLFFEYAQRRARGSCRRLASWPGIATTVGIVLIAVVSTWLNVWGPVWRASWTATPEQWLGFAGAVLGGAITAIVAGAAIYFGWQSSNKQVRISLISREEDRITEQLPGLHDAEEFLATLVSQIRLSPLPDAVVELLRAHGLGTNGTNVSPEVAKKFPRMVDRSRRRMTELLFDVNIAAIKAKSAAQAAHAATENVAQIAFRPPQQEEAIRATNASTLATLGEAWLELCVSIEELASFHKYVLTTIGIMEERVPRLRNEIEAFFS